jgi:hypothetical protein
MNITERSHMWGALGLYVAVAALCLVLLLR